MSGVTKLGLALILVLVFFLLALAAELVYVIWYRRRRTPQVAGHGADDLEFVATSCDSDFPGTPKSKAVLLYMLCWKNQSRIEPTPSAVELAPSASGFVRQCPPASRSKPPPHPAASDEAVEAELAKWRALYASRVLFTIREEDKEETESEGGSARIVAGRIHYTEEKSADQQLEQAVGLDVWATTTAAKVDEEEVEQKHMVGEDADPASHFTPFSTPCASPPFYTPSPSPPRGPDSGADSEALPDAIRPESDDEMFAPAEDVATLAGAAYSEARGQVCSPAAICTATQGQ